MKVCAFQFFCKERKFHQRDSIDFLRVALGNKIRLYQQKVSTAFWRIHQKMAISAKSISLMCLHYV